MRKYLAGLLIGLVVAWGLYGAVEYAKANFAAVWQNTTPSVNGPWLGDTIININSIWQAITTSSGTNYWPGNSVSQTSGQANCTQLNTGISEVKTSAATGYVCLPTAVGGRQVYIANATTQTIDIYGSAATFLSGTQDTINGTAGTTPYTNLTSGKTADCVAANNGAWYCASSN